MQGGHGDIVRSIARSGHFDEVWVVPVYRHPYTTAAKSRLEDSYEHRLRMCELGLCGGGTPSCPVVISRIEEEVFSYLAKQPVAPLRIGTIDTIDYLIRKFEGSIQFHLVLGSDAYGDLRAGKWKHSER
jgi:nicotinic acid mononucleotide adenylyltransferase